MRIFLENLKILRGKDITPFVVASSYLQTTSCPMDQEARPVDFRQPSVPGASHVSAQRTGTKTKGPGQPRLRQRRHPLAAAEISRPGTGALLATTRTERRGVGPRARPAAAPRSRPDSPPRGRRDQHAERLHQRLRTATRLSQDAALKAPRPPGFQGSEQRPESAPRRAFPAARPPRAGGDRRPCGSQGGHPLPDRPRPGTRGTKRDDATRARAGSAHPRPGRTRIPAPRVLTRRPRTARAGSPGAPRTCAHVRSCPGR